MHAVRKQMEAAWDECTYTGAARLATLPLIVLCSKTSCPPRLARPGRRKWKCNETGTMVRGLLHFNPSFFRPLGDFTAVHSQRH
jgi:hypothetical protein